MDAALIEPDLDGDSRLDRDVGMSLDRSPCEIEAVYDPLVSESCFSWNDSRD